MVLKLSTTLCPYIWRKEEYTKGKVQRGVKFLFICVYISFKMAALLRQTSAAIEREALLVQLNNPATFKDRKPFPSGGHDSVNAWMKMTWKTDFCADFDFLKS